MEVESYVRTYDNVLAPDVCKSIIEAFSKSNSEYIDREQRPAFTHLYLEIEENT